ncbi:MAG: DUF6062 family protein [Firmicutes bacterium]|nr:DUF6062 family protein [Bacillota bacterium]MDH7495359.1 DUF6062 family protein [Bacillota bacterium]
MTKHATYHNLRDAMKKPGCFVCRLTNEMVDRYLDMFLYENVNDVDVRRDLRESNGFCPTHARQLREHGDPLGHSIIYVDLIDGVLDSLRSLLASHLHPSGKLTISQVRRLVPGQECPACCVARESQERYVAVLLEELTSDPLFEMEFAASSGLCLSHLARALEVSRNAETARRLLRVSIGKLEELKTHLGEVIRKHDYRFSKEPWGDEKDAWIRATQVWSGLPQTALPTAPPHG